MPRRNYLVIFGVAIVSVMCYQAADRNPLGRYFAEVADLVERRYVDRVDRNTLWAGAVQGMLEKLGDPNSEYINPRDAAELDELLEQEFGGIGVQVLPDPRHGGLTVASPMFGSPAYRAGILAGDVITKIDGKTTQGMAYAEATARIRGKPGDVVRVTVERPGESQPLEFAIPRAMVNVDSVLGDTRNGDDHWNFMLRRKPNIGYVRIISFGRRTAEELKAALEQLRAQQVQGLVLDLRNNPGGLVPAAIGVCDLLVPKGQPIVTIKGREMEDDRKVAGGGEKFLDFPIVVLVNQLSASASEIVAACLQDSGRAVVIGARTYGKGTVQHVIALHPGSGALRLTTADYVRPNGHNIHRREGATESDEWGVSPDAGFEAKMSDDELRKWAQWRGQRDRVVRRNGNGKANGNGASGGNGADKAQHTDTAKQTDAATQNDPQLRRAVEYLQSKIAG